MDQALERHGRRERAWWTAPMVNNTAPTPTRHQHDVRRADTVQCRRHGLCHVGDMAPTCRHVCRFGEKKSPTRRRHYQPSGENLAKNMGHIHNYLGMVFNYATDREVHVNMSQYLDKVISEFRKRLREWLLLQQLTTYFKCEMMVESSTTNKPKRSTIQSTTVYF